MRQVWISHFGGPEILEFRESPDPHPSPGEVLIRVEAAGVNFADIVARRGLYPDAPKPPFVPGLEVSGIVEELGQGVDASWSGKTVIALCRFGGYSDKIRVPLSQVFLKPKTLDMNQAAALPVNYLTAWDALVVMGSLKSGDKLLIHNAGGGVGLAALDIAKHLGAETFGTAGPGKQTFLEKRGLDHYINYRESDWEMNLMDLTKGRGMDLILDPLGGSNWKKSYRALAPTGKLGCYGVSALRGSGLAALPSLLSMLFALPWFNPISLMNSNKGVFGLNLGRLWGEGERIRDWMTEILKGVEENWIRPHVDSSFPLARAQAAHRRLESRQNIGKVLLVPSP